MTSVALRILTNLLSLAALTAAGTVVVILAAHAAPLFEKVA